MSASVFPARAGMSRPQPLTLRWSSRVPRASGDEPLEVSADTDPNRCSPRERG